MSLCRSLLFPFLQQFYHLLSLTNQLHQLIHKNEEKKSNRERQKKKKNDSMSKRSRLIDGHNKPQQFHWNTPNKRKSIQFACDFIRRAREHGSFSVFLAVSCGSSAFLQNFHSKNVNSKMIICLGRHLCSSGRCRSSFVVGVVDVMIFVLSSYTQPAIHSLHVVDVILLNFLFYVSLSLLFVHFKIYLTLENRITSTNGTHTHTHGICCVYLVNTHGAYIIF